MRTQMIVAVSVASLLATGAAAAEVPAPAEPTVGATEQAVSDAIGVLCIPVLISGQLAAEELISSSRFVAGSPRHAPPQDTSAFSSQLESGDVVEVFANLKGRMCTIHVYGDDGVASDYRAALRAQNWTLFIPAITSKEGAIMEGWRVNLGAKVGDARQAIILAAPGLTDASEPKITAMFTLVR